MKLWIKRTVEFIFILSAFFMIFMFINEYNSGQSELQNKQTKAISTPSALPGINTKGAISPDQDDTGTAVSETRLTDKISPKHLTQLFFLPIPEPAAEKAPSSPVIKEPEVAGWLKYIGRVENSAGVNLEYFKDKKTGRVLKLSRGNPSGDWSLEGKKENMFLLSKAGEKYYVSTE